VTAQVVSASSAHGPKTACLRRAYGKSPGPARNCANNIVPSIRKIEHLSPEIHLFNRPSERSHILPVVARINSPRGQNHESANGIWRVLTCCAEMRDCARALCPMIRAFLRGNPTLPSPERALSNSTKINSPRGQKHESGNGI
jgi:hypothetical protein